MSAGNAAALSRGAAHVTFIERSIAEERHRDILAHGQLERESRSDRERHRSADDRHGAEHPRLRRKKVHRPPPAAGTARGSTEDLSHHRAEISAFGDVVALRSSDRQIRHMCVHIADNVVFTKPADPNGPWVLMSLGEMVKQFPSDTPLQMLVYRKKEI